MPQRVDVADGAGEGRGRVLTPEAIGFIVELHDAFDQRRRDLLGSREERQNRIDSGELPGFLPETEDVRSGHWQVSTNPVSLADRRVEITGPTDRKMVINGLNSGAKVFMADFEDANSPTWPNMIEGQSNLIKAIDGTIEFTDPTGRRIPAG